jgi:hypothetical protein
MKLQLVQTLSGAVPPEYERHFNRNYTFTTEIAGEEILYVFAPQKLVDDYTDGSQVGFSEGEMIFINKHLHPAQVPFAALYLHYQTLSTEELEEKFGEETIEALGKNCLVLSATLDLASQYLRPEEMLSFTEKVVGDASCNVRIHSDILEDIITAYSPDQNSTTALIAREDASLELYVETVGDYMRAHRNNKWTKRSQSLLNACEGFSGRLDRLLRGYITTCESAHRAIVEDPNLNDKLPEIFELIETIGNLDVGTQVELGATESRILYLCLEPFEDGTYRKSSAPISFVDENTETRTNTIEIRGRAKQYFAALRKRIGVNILGEYENTVKALEGIGEVVTRVGDGEEDLALIGQRVTRLLVPPETVSDGTEIQEVPAQQTEDLVDNLREQERHYALTLTSAPLRVRELHKIARARRLLTDLGLPTTDLEGLAHGLLTQGKDIIRAIKPVPVLEDNGD